MNKKFYKWIKLIASFSLISIDFHDMLSTSFNPLIRGCVFGLVIYAIWFAKERTE